jgi:hypothetical protein
MKKTLELINQQRLADAIDGSVFLPIPADRFHSRHVMGTDDVDARRRPIPDQPIESFLRWNILRQSVVGRTIKRRERVHVHVHEMVIQNVCGSLLDTLSPIDIRVIQNQRPLSGASSEFVEIGNVVGKRVNCRPRLPHEQYGYDCNPGAAASQAFHNSACPHKQQGKNWNHIAKPDLHGSDAINHEVEHDARYQNDFAPPVSQSFLEIEQRGSREQNRWYRCFDRESDEEVVPPATGLQFAEQIPWISGYDFDIHHQAVAEVDRRPLRKEICRLDDEQRSASHYQQSFDRRAAVAGNADDDDQQRQEHAGKFGRHCRAERESGEEIFLFPEEVQRENREDCQWNVRGNKHAVRKQIRRERIHGRREKSLGYSEHISCPEKRDNQTHRSKKDHHRAAPEKKSIGIVVIKEVESELEFRCSFPVFSSRAEFRTKQEKRKRGHQFSQRWMFRIQSEVVRLPIAEAGDKVDRFIVGCGKFWNSQQGLKAEGH